MADLKKLAEEIVGLTLLEAQELKTILKDEYGIEPAAGGAVMMAQSGGGDTGGGAETDRVYCCFSCGWSTENKCYKRSANNNWFRLERS